MTGWLDLVPAEWEIVSPRRHFQERREPSRPDDVHLTPSQHHGVLPQTEYMELTGSRVVLNLTGADNMKHVEPGDSIGHLRSFQGGLETSPLAGKVSNAYTVIRPGPDADYRYFRWVFKSAAFVQQLAAHSQSLRDGQAVKYEDLASIELPMPPLDEQRRIADFLDDRVSRIDRIIAARREQIDLVDTQKGAIVAAAFEPWANQRVAVKRMLARRPDYGCLPEVTSDEPSWPRYIRTTDISEAGKLREDGAITTDPSLLADYRLRRGDVLVARSGSVGKCMVFDGVEPAVFAGYLVRLQFHSIAPRLFWYFTHTANFRDQINANAIQSTILNFNAERYASMTLPDLREADPSLLDHLDANFEVLERANADLSRSIDLLTAYKSSLITAAVTGELDVSSAGSSIPE